MVEQTLLIPLIACTLGIILAALAGHPALNRRLTIIQLGWLVGLTPAVAFGAILARLPDIQQGDVMEYAITWMPSLDMQASLYLDNLSALFGLLVTGIGVLVIVYAGYYFKGDQTAWRFICYMMFFMTSMLGLVMAGDVITLFLFWEGTSITSYLLIGYKYKDDEARRGAFKALFITAGGGIPLLAGLLFIASVSGGSDYVTILNNGDVLVASPWYIVMLSLVAFGAFTKSAQTPAHIWLPDAMSAPTPASAYLHSATMVKAGIYLMARLNPALGGTDAWFWLLAAFGLVTMVVGAYLGLKQNDLKALLAYSTVSQLGALMMLIGFDNPDAFKALIIGILAHALYKCALFLIAGIVDHETGTRDLRRLGGIGREMPYTLAVGTLAALSMAGLIPLFGFLAKETLLVTVLGPMVSDLVQPIFIVAAVFTGAFLLAQSAMLIYDTFLGQQRDPSVHAHEAPFGMLLGPAIPAVLSLGLGLLGLFVVEPFGLITLLAGAAQSAYGANVSLSLALWHGVNLPLILSLIAIVVGATLFYFRQQVRQVQNRINRDFSLNGLHERTLELIDRGAYVVTRTQYGYLRHYLAVMLMAMGGLLIGFNALPPLLQFGDLTSPELSLAGELPILRAFVLALSAITAIMTIFLSRDLPAILALGASGFAVAVVMILEPAPDVALVQVVVDILAVVILVLALTRLPRPQRARAHELTFEQSRPSLIRDTILAIGGGLVMTLLVLNALVTRPFRDSLVTPYYELNAIPGANATDVVGAILVDFRAFDTFMEVVVFCVAGMGAYMLLRYAARTAGDKGDDAPMQFYGPMALRLAAHIKGIGGTQSSPFLQALAHALLPLSILLALVHLMYGHDQPGDGFTAGVIISLAVAFWYVVFGYSHTQQHLAWLKPGYFIGGGLLLVVISGSVAAFINGHFLSPVNFGQMLNIPTPRGFYISTALLFELAICLGIVGGVLFVIDTLGRPEDDDPESLWQLQEMTVLEKKGIISLPEKIQAAIEKQLSDEE
jgi:NADH:ubiquinone oxidoreductase subunit 5 (subunit L)/multisubunit Na+/H+ antiporter MnhA subunit/multisubunit Na+/H+ antiporter MnhB subunit